MQTSGLVSQISFLGIGGGSDSLVLKMHGCVALKNLLHRLMFFRKAGCHLRRSSCIIPCLKGCRLTFAPAAAP